MTKTTNNRENSKINIITIVLIILIFGPILDYFYHLSMFSRDAAPDRDRIIANTILFLIYSLSAFLFMKKKFWARWISFSLYFVWFIVALIMIDQKRNISSLISYLEVIIRLSILIVLLKSTSWIKNYRTNKSL